MNIIPQISMFGDNEFEDLGDLERLQAVLSALPDEKLIRALYRIRGQGRNDWPCVYTRQFYSQRQHKTE